MSKVVAFLVCSALAFPALSQGIQNPAGVAGSFTATAPSGGNAVKLATGAAICLNAPTCTITIKHDGTNILLNGAVVALGANATMSTSGRLTVSSGVQSSNNTLPTCAAGTLGLLLTQSTAASTVRTRLCYCTSDNAASPTYAWQNLASAALGNTTTCP